MHIQKNNITGNSVCILILICGAILIMTEIGTLPAHAQSLYSIDLSDGWQNEWSIRESEGWKNNQWVLGKIDGMKNTWSMSANTEKGLDSPECREIQAEYTGLEYELRNNPHICDTYCEQKKKNRMWILEGRMIMTCKKENLKN